MVILREALDRTNFDDVAEPSLLDPVTPGDVLRDEFMAPLELSARALAREMNVPPNRITEILNGERSVTAETAILLGRRFSNSARFWMNLQVAHDLAVAKRKIANAA